MTWSLAAVAVIGVVCGYWFIRRRRDRDRPVSPRWLVTHAYDRDGDDRHVKGGYE